MGKKQRPTKSQACYNGYNSIDMFGSEVKFNVDGKERYDTCLGATCSLIIVLLLAALSLSSTVMYKTNTAIPFVQTQT